jgi:diguanylate cyclase (GGDEF)-like protein
VEVFSDNTSTMAAIEQMALLDPLTELANRRYLENSLRAKLSELYRCDWPFAALFVDIDHFEAANDRHGHAVGDRVLKMVVNTLLGASARST